MGTFITLPGVNPGTDMPRVDLPDAIMPDQGALLLIEPGHPANKSTAPLANGLAIPNVAWQQARSMVGAGGADTLGMTLSLSGFAAPDGLIERTSKGGLHGIPSQRSAMTDGKYARLDVVDSVKAYMLANPTHDFAVTMATRTTRTAKPGPSTNTILRRFLLTGTNPASVYLAQLFLNNSPTANEEIGNTSNGIYPNGSTGAAQHAGSTQADWTPGAPSVGPRRWSLGVLGWNGTAPTTTPNFLARTGWGPSFTGNMGIDQSGTPTGPDAYPSWVLYWLYVEDLTVSGRTWSDVNTLDRAKYLREVVNPGGRYYGDTFTAPSTVA